MERYLLMMIGLWDSAMATSKYLLARLSVEHCVHEGCMHSPLYFLMLALLAGCMADTMIRNQARGLDVLPTTISRFCSGGDDCTADLLETAVYPEEITHCAAGVKWFKYLCLRAQTTAPSHCHINSQNTAVERDLLEEEQINKKDNGAAEFPGQVIGDFRDPLKPPFNEHARKAAGFGP